jgi:hypothetical protein
MSDDEFPFIRDLSRPRAALPAAERARLHRLGLMPEDMDALERVLAMVPETDGKRETVRRLVSEGMIHYRRHGAGIVAKLGKALDKVLKRGLSEIGAERLTGFAWVTLTGFRVDNNNRGLYAHLAAAKRPDSTLKIKGRKTWVNLLAAAGWPPLAGEEGDETPAGSPSPTPGPMATTSPSTESAR